MDASILNIRILGEQTKSQTGHAAGSKLPGKTPLEFDIGDGLGLQ